MCIFCDIISGKIPSSKVYEDDDVLAILDVSQVTFGHTLVMPKKHVLNNCGEVAGQTVHHLHFHIIPRYSESDAVCFQFNESEKQNLAKVLEKVKG